MSSESNELIIGANIVFPEINSGAITNSYGFFSITIPEGVYKVEISSIGFKNISKKIFLQKDLKVNYYLEENIENLNEVVVTKNVEEIDIKKPIMSLNILSNKTIKQTPVLFGESDLLKTIQLLPGVSNSGEGTGGFNVRGGAGDQNLILFDEAIIYNSSHLFGLFSVFNSDAIKELKLYKGGIPASYGGRLSSVLDVYQKDGNSKSNKFSGGIGLISSRLLFEGPIQKNKSSFLIAGRGSYAHLFLKLTDIENVAYFYDLNTKSNFKIDDKNTLYFSGYFGRDLFRLNNTFSNTYGNSTINLRWNHLLSDKTFTNTSVIYSDYYYGLTLDFIGFNWNSGIKNLNIKFDLKNYYSEKIQFNYGLNSIYYEFNPGEIKPINGSGINYKNLNKKYALENSAYFDVIHNISKRFALRYGLRFNQFLRFKQNGLNSYLNDNPVLIKQNTLLKESLAFRIARNFESISYMDSIFDTYGRTISELTKGTASEISMVDINVTNIHMLFDQKALLMEQNEKLQLLLLNQDKTVSLINKPMLSVKKSILDVKMVTYPILLIVLFVMLSMMRYYFQKAKNLSNQRNISDTESTDNVN